MACVKALPVAWAGLVLQPYLSDSGPQRWPAFAAAALEAGILAIFALPLQVGAIRVGVLDLYRDRVGVLSDGEPAEPLSFADAATTLLLQMQTAPTDVTSGRYP
jgi:hypothetical protein